MSESTPSNNPIHNLASIPRAAQLAIADESQNIPTAEDVALRVV